MSGVEVTQPGVDVVVFGIPIRTKSATNLREHWTKRKRRVGAERTATRVAWYACNTKLPKLPAVVTLHRIAPRRLDDDNLRGALKGVRDEIAKLYGVDDGGDSIRWEYRQRGGKPKQYGVEVWIESNTTETKSA